MGVTSGAGTTYPSRAPEFTPDCSGNHVAQTLVFCVVYCRSLLTKENEQRKNIVGKILHKNLSIGRLRTPLKTGFTQMLRRGK
jgi:hypothetical protein